MSTQKGKPTQKTYFNYKKWDKCPIKKKNIQYYDFNKK